MVKKLKLKHTLHKECLLKLRIINQLKSEEAQIMIKFQTMMDKKDHRLDCQTPNQITNHKILNLIKILYKNKNRQVKVVFWSLKFLN